MKEAIESSSEISLLITLACVIVGGALGGISVFLANINFTGLVEKLYEGRESRSIPQFLHDSGNLNFVAFVLIALHNSIIGITGAFVVLLAILLLNKFPVGETTQNVLFIIGLSVVGGFGARRFLPLMVLNIEDVLNRVSSEASRNREEIIQETQQMNKENLLMSAAAASLGSSATEVERRWTLQTLTDSLNKGTLEPSGYIILSRLQRRLGDLKGATATLTRFINENQNTREPNQSIHTAHYNRACYYSLLSGQTNDESYINHAVADLIMAMKYSSNRNSDTEFAKNDPDLALVRAGSRFAEIFSKYDTPEN